MFLELARKKLRYDSEMTISLIDHLVAHNVIDPSIVNLIGHISAARLIWIERIINDVSYIRGVWPNLNLPESVRIFKSSDDKWKMFLNNAAEDEFAKIIRYKTTAGVEMENMTLDIFEHVINHGTHHRAQIISKLKALDIPIIPADYILWAGKQHWKQPR